MLTLTLSLVMMAGLFLMLLSGVGFIQDKRFFTSAPREVREAVGEKEERFAGQRLLGWMMAALSVALMAGAIVRRMGRHPERLCLRAVFCPVRGNAPAAESFRYFVF